MAFFTGSSIGIFRKPSILAKSLMVKYQIYLLSQHATIAEIKIRLFDYFNRYVRACILYSVNAVEFL